MERQKDVTLKDELPRSVGAQYATGEVQRKSYRRNERLIKVERMPSCGCVWW